MDLGDLPELDDFFNSAPHVVKQSEEIVSGSIFIQFSKEKDSWIDARFINIAIAGIGIHLGLPLKSELNSLELRNSRIKFLRKENDLDIVLKEVPVLVRWQEKDSITGMLKVGLHFDRESINDPIFTNVLKELKEKSVK
ncbi:MAG: hypothetical protein KA885_05645 [Spirochaetes bacterium]|nr:hypothetical protein [Spirochaetota bacterium]